MKKIGLFLLLFAASAMVLSSCGNDNDEPAYGKIEYDGRTFKITPYYINVSLPESVSFSSYSCLLLTNNDVESSSIQANLWIGDPHENFEYEVTFNSEITFMHGHTYYSPLRGFYNDSESDEYLLAVKSVGIDPETGQAIFSMGQSNVYKGITGGRVKWTAGKNSAKLEFNLTLEGGKTAKGNATIPYSVFEESRY